MLARKTHAPNCIFWGGLLAGFNPSPPFLPPTSGDSVMMEKASPVLHLSQIFDLVMRGELDRVFFSGAQIDQFGNLNNSYIGSLEKIRVKLPGGAGASHIGCLAKNFTIWSVRHEAKTGGKGKKVYTFVEKVDFVTTVGQKANGRTRKELGLKGGGPDRVITNLGVFDFDPESKMMRLHTVHPGVTVQDILKNTGFAPVIQDRVSPTQPPTAEEIAIIRTIDPLNTRKLGFSSEALAKRYEIQ
ncbi:MAG: hypothetical protein NTY64_14060, partial [Deltaproteobacteria bacterium]|nr:hypothetical protein [Deltaproteobacteria bacterium]